MSTKTSGVLFALSAYTFWGVAPLYFQWVAFATPAEILIHRVLWSVLVLTGLILLTRRLPVVGRILQDRRSLGLLFLSAALIAVNWWVFVWAVQQARLVEASLGYYINPLVSVLLGLVVLGERLTTLQWAALLIAVFAVGYEVAAFGAVPWVALLLAFSFGFYGLVRKAAAVDSLVGLAVETALLSPFAIAGLFFLGADRQFLQIDLSHDLALISAGLVTIFPLVCFAAAARRLPLSLLGFIQYLAPSISLVLAVQWFGEPFEARQWMTFGAIWLALILFSTDGLIRGLRKPKPARV